MSPTTSTLLNVLSVIVIVAIVVLAIVNNRRSRGAPDDK
jgi:hypothetical protein